MVRPPLTGGLAKPGSDPLINIGLAVQHSPSSLDELRAEAGDAGSFEGTF
jgi:hypothetical protein